MKGFRNYRILKMGHQIVLLVYKYSQDFPWEETNGITNQLRLTALSIPKNISEMISRDFNNGYDFFLISVISLIDKLRYLLMLAVHLGYLKKGDRKHIIQKISGLKKELNLLNKEVELS